MKSELGTAMLEFTLVATSMIWLILTPFKICDVIHYRERLANLSQETASVAFRDCTSRAMDKLKLTTCLKLVAANAERNAREQFPGGDFTIVINMFHSGAHAPNYPIASSWKNGCGRGELDCPATVRGREFRRTLNRRHDPRETSVLNEQQYLTISELNLKPAFSLPSLLQISGTERFHEIGIY